ncbi:hypothetical protein ABPG74_019366 [Tetrahymena malaccensis]
MIRFGLVLVATGLIIKGTVRAYRELKLMSRAAQNQYNYQNQKDLFKFEKGVGFQNPMTKEEAEHIFGIYSPSSLANLEEINKRHRQLMKINHPDQRGSQYIAQKINEAKDLLSK